MTTQSERANYPAVETDSAFGAVKVVITPDGARIAVAEERPITINRIAYYGDIYLEQRPTGYQVVHNYLKRVGGGWSSEITEGARSIIWNEAPKLIDALLADGSLLVSMRAAEIHNAIHERSATIEARQREIAILQEEIAALEQERPEDGRPYMAAYRLKGSKTYSEPERIEYRAPNDVAAAARARDLAPTGAERYSVYALPAAGVLLKARDLGPSYWISSDDD